MYDLAIIGGGPGGYTAAERAGAAGLSVVLFEKNELGGVCLNEGCIPTKTLLYSAKVFDYARHADLYGVSVEGASFDYSKILKRKTKVVRKLVGGVKLKMKNSGVTVVGGEAVIAGPVAGGFVVSCGGTEYVASRLLICTGSEAVVPPIPGIKEAGDVIVTNREILALEEPPAELVVIGGGVIGMEFASFFNSIGSKVTVIEMMPKILGPMDSEISELLQKQYAKKGVEFRLGCKVTGIEGDTVVYEDPEGNVCRVHGDKILVSVGRRARLEGYGLETLGVSLALTPAGRPYGIKVDDRMRTDVPGVYAAGDATGFSLLAHTAVREAEVAVNDILGRDDKMSYKAIPGVVYTNPEVAGVGLTQDEAARKGIDVTVLKLPMAYSGRFVAENERGEGLCKILVCPSSHEVLGVHMLGNPSSEMIHSACIAIEQGMTVEQLKEVVFPHPTVSEILKETVFTL
ncbi:MAG: dihydrolipoyl dehydrogenase [Bacteroidales bacterium]|nr:dihydrolipoyl dehydrogenase [Bacteroidales bacterium]